MKQRPSLKSTKMHIAHFESSMNWGGQELRIVEQSRWLIENGYATWIIARPGAEIITHARDYQIPVFVLPVHGALHPKTLYRLLRFIKANKIDILDCHSTKDAYYGLWVKLFTSIRVVRSRHVTDNIKDSFFHRQVWLHGNDLIVTTADQINHQIRTKGLSHHERIYTALPGVDPKRFTFKGFSKTELKEQVGLNTDHFIAANIGMIRPDKGQIFFVRACLQMAADPLMECIQVGEPTKSTQDYFKAIQHEIQQSEDNTHIKFIGYRKDIEKYIAAADVIVIASIATEAQTRLVSQAFFARTPVIATRVGGLPDMIKNNETGILCAKEDPEEIISAIQLLKSDDRLREDIVNNAFQYAQNHYSTDKMMEGLVEQYQSLLTPSIIGTKKGPE